MGGGRGPWHRLAHCDQENLPAEPKGRSLNYIIVDLTEIMMTEQKLLDLFSEMDAVAADVCSGLLRVISHLGGWASDEPSSPPLPVRQEDLQVAFRQLQRRDYPNLTRDQWLSRFALWREHGAARHEAEQAATYAREEQRNLLVERKFMSSDPERLRAIETRLASLPGRFPWPT
jgi:hypothetical protein